MTTRVPAPDTALGWMTVALLFSAEKIVEIQARRYSSADILLPDKLPITRAEFEASRQSKRTKNLL